MDTKTLLLTTDAAVLPLAGWFILFCIKHVVADFLLQPHWMAVGKEQASGWLRPLTAHCTIHGACAMLIILVLRPGMWPLGILDPVVHFGIDRSKGLLMTRFRLTPAEGGFWTLLGIDQTLHHLTGFALAAVIVASVSA